MYGEARLLDHKVPAQIGHGEDSSQVQVHTLEAGTAFTTAIDAVEMNRTGKEDLVPVLQDVLTPLTLIPTIPYDFEPIIKIRQWIRLAGEMSFADTLDEDQCRQLRFDLQQGYDQLRTHLFAPRTSARG